MSNGIDETATRNLNRASRATILVTILLCLYWGMLFYGTHMPLPVGALPGHSDKWIHCFAYALLAILLLSLRAIRGPFQWTSIVARWLFLAFYGAFDEITQALVKRSPDLEDWFADLLGAAVGLAFVTIALKLFRAPSKPSPDVIPEVAAQ